MRTKGAIDKVVSRKVRSDVGKKRMAYRGNPVVGRTKKKTRIRTTPDKTHLWLRAYKRVPMTKDGYLNWKPHLRSKVYKEITNMKESPTFPEVPIYMIDTKDKFENFFAMNLPEGKFVIMGGGSGKTKTHFKCYPICTIVVRETPDGNVAEIIQNKRLSKYKWFYKG